MSTTESGKRRSTYEKLTVTLMVTEEQRDRLTSYFDANPKITRAHWYTEAFMEKLDREDKERTA